MSLPIVLSYIQAQALLCARQAGEASAVLSPDLGLSTVQVTLDAEGVCFPNGERLSWHTLERIAVARNVCFALEGGTPREIRRFSDTTGWVRADADQWRADDACRRAADAPHQGH